MGYRLPRYSRGFSLVEVVISATLVTLLLTVMVPAAMRMVDAARDNKAAGQIEEIAAQIDAFHRENGRYPISLLEIYANTPVDAWNNPYQYLNLSEGLKKTKNKARKNKYLKYINSDYDLYSMGPDGQSVAPLTAQPSRDDIIRADNGGFIGTAQDYQP